VKILIFTKKKNGSKGVKRNMKRESTGPAFFLPQKEITTNRKIDRIKRSSNDAESDKTRNECSGAYMNKAYENDNVRGKNDDSGSTDPTSCEVELTLYTAKVVPAGLTTPVKQATMMELSNLDNHAGAKEEVILVAKIDDNYYQVDLNHINNISVEHSEDNRSPLFSDSIDGTTNDEAIAGVSTSLILEFPSCFFRFFSSGTLTKPTSDDSTVVGDSNSFKGTDDGGKKFDTVRKKLEKMLSIDCSLSFPVRDSGLKILSEHLLGPNAIFQCREDNNCDPLSCARQCLRSYTKSWKDLIMFDDALENPLRIQPHSEPLMGSALEDRFKDTVNQSMTNIPKHFSSCFIEEDKWTNAIELHGNKISMKLKEFHDVIDEFWIGPSQHESSNKRRRTDEDHCINPGKSMSMIEQHCVKRFAQSLKDHKNLMFSKHELHLLPIRR